jgi:hypothetical protein
MTRDPELVFRIVDLATLEASDALRFARLFAGFARIYHAAFPDASERERPEDWIARLRGRQPPPNPTS